MRSYFYELADKFLAQQKGHNILLNFAGEQSDFCRLNKAKVRQAGAVKQNYCTMKLIEGRRHINHVVTCSGELGHDLDLMNSACKELQTQIKHMPEDPFLLLPDRIESSEQIGENQLVASQSTVERCLGRVNDLDFVGIYAQGGIFRGFANSAGQRNWYESYTHNFEWSVYLRADKAIKQCYAGQKWDQQSFDAKINEAREMLPRLKQEPRELKPGRYRAYFSPTAVDEILELWNWGGFSKKAQATKTASFAKLYLGERKLSPQFTLEENLENGLSPRFNMQGFTLPASVSLLKEGAYCDSLVSPRSALEYKVHQNTADSERAVSFDMAPGRIANEKILETLDTGLMVNNLWYLNYSDRIAGRLTGMTRFACFWVEKGKIQAPLNVMRFDDSLQNIFGDGLEGVTTQRDVILDSTTYGSRSTKNSCLPGMIVKNFNLVL